MSITSKDISLITTALQKQMEFLVKGEVESALHNILPRVVERKLHEHLHSEVVGRAVHEIADAARERVKRHLRKALEETA